MTIPSGALRFNSDSRKLEYYNGEAWWQIDSFTPDSATGGARGVFGIVSPSYGNTLEYITISTTGNSIDFGDITRVTGNQASLCSSATRGLCAGGVIAPAAAFTNIIDYVTISITSNAIDFGDLITANRYLTALANSTRGIFAGAAGPITNAIDYVTIAQTGNGIDFGDLSVSRGNSGAAASNTRGLIAGGEGGTNVIDFITISTLGNAADFGDLLVTRYGVSGCSNSTRGLFASGYAYNVPAAPTTAIYNVIEYVTITTTGNALDFGDLTTARGHAFSLASSTRGVFAGGSLFPSISNVIDYVSIMSTGNAIDFGDLSAAAGASSGGMSNGHGGL
jgi:hypothetical protein